MKAAMWSTYTRWQSKQKKAATAEAKQLSFAATLHHQENKQLDVVVRISRMVSVTTC